MGLSRGREGQLRRLALVPGRHEELLPRTGVDHGDPTVAGVVHARLLELRQRLVLLIAARDVDLV